jgi:leucyl-tRNA synthetase
MWSILGHEPGIALVGFASCDESLLVESSIVAVIQVDGKLRDKVEVPTNITEEALRELALNSDAVKRSIGERKIANIIVRAPKLVNIATEA